ncbi:hypothetical protein SCL_0927 [Sulfuricaulis limicola]|uniref:Uncharacterized protein n=1 Tax=Sulfuricaulis limicola TaxID=1620215 RepID=A0A1B4XEL3_9GAMM|nr:PilC/PilY family type IV pilus protein [Sulfuricaulis limicola]BAV33244.1 hypothetical protein SCL_0927 [Sulfuricaulis limicola]
MTTHRKHFNHLFCVLLSGALVALSGILPASAKDTDVYLMAPTVARDDSPNVLLIIDNSISMDAIITSAPAYNSSVDYCSATAVDAIVSGASSGIPSSCATYSGRVYWSFNSSAPALTSNSWFAATKNHCEQSKTSLNGSSGQYGNNRVAGLITSGTSYNWASIRNKTDSDITFIDCQPDGSNSDGYPKKNPVAANTVAGAYTNGGTSQRFDWTTFNTDHRPTLYSANYLAYASNAMLQQDITRLDVAKATLKDLIDSNPGIRFGLMAFNNNNNTPHGGRVLMRVDTMDDARRTTMKNIIDSLGPDTTTPLAETMWEAYRYYAGLTATYGNPSSSMTPNQDSCAQNVTSSYCNDGKLYRATNGQYSNSSGAILSGGTTDTTYNDGTYISPFKYGCQTGYIIYVTDGDPTNDEAADTTIDALSGIGTPTIVDYYAGTGFASANHKSRLSVLAEWMSKNDVYSGLPLDQKITTFTIGFGTGISVPGKALLQETATKSGGKYSDAVDASSLSSALKGALAEVWNETTSFVAPSLSINAFNKLYNRDDVYFALFQPTSTVRWDGNLKKLKLCNGKETPACTFGEVIDKDNIAAINTSTSKIKDTSISYWGTTADGSDVNKGGAGAKITQNSEVPRALYTYTGSYASASMPATPVAIEAATTLGGSSTNTIRNAAVANPAILGLPSTATATEVDKLINWMRGQDAYDKDNDGNTTETRSWNFADPLHSRPVAFTYGAVTTLGVVDKNNPIIKIFISTNDGTVRIINDDDGTEEWAFIPNELLSQQYALSQNADGGHIYGLDDSPTFMVTDVNNDGIIDYAAGDRVYMYIGMRRGGRNLYAFDVSPTSPTKLTSHSDTVTPKLLWVIQGGTGDFAKLGQTWSRPKVVRIRAKCTGSVCDDSNPATDDSESRMVLIFGGGYDTIQDNSLPAGPDSMGNAIYIVDPFTGSRIWWASSAAGANLVLSDMQYSIPSEITTIDTNGDKSVDRLYVGDVSGQVWRIDLGDQIGAASNDGSKGFVFADVTCSRNASNVRDCSAVTKQNWRKFFYPPDVAMVKDAAYSTDTNYDLVAIGSGDREDPLDLLTSNSSPVAEAVHNRIYAFRDYDYKTGAPASMLLTTPTTPFAITHSVMYDATSNNLGTMTGATLQTEINTNVKNSKGWFFDLKELSAVALNNGLTTQWVGEKVLAKPVIFDGVLFFTTFIPANVSTAQNTCQANEGEGRYYEVNYLTGSPVYNLAGDSTLDRYAFAGGGIPSEVIIVIRDGGVTGLVGTSGGAKQVDPGSGSNRYKTFWWDE